jgi:hypothetical protein
MTINVTLQSYRLLPTYRHPIFLLAPYLRKAGCNKFFRILPYCTASQLYSPPLSLQGKINGLPFILAEAAIFGVRPEAVGCSF